MSARHLSLLTLAIIILLTGCQTVTGSPNAPLAGNTEEATLDTWGNDPVMNLLGKRFDEIEQELGTPDEQGYDDWLGPHHYILFQHERGVMRIASPNHIEPRIAVSIILGPGQEVLDAKVGMTLEEIMAILGEPDFGPDRGMDNLYHMDYYFGRQLDDGMPEVFVSFSARAIDAPTDEAFIKWESFEHHVLSNGISSVPSEVPVILEGPEQQHNFGVNSCE